MYFFLIYLFVGNYYYIRRIPFPNKGIESIFFKIYLFVGNCYYIRRVPFPNKGIVLLKYSSQAE